MEEAPFMPPPAARPQLPRGGGGTGLCEVSGSPCWRRWHNTATGSAGSAGTPDRTAVSNGVLHARRHRSEST